LKREKNQPKKAETCYFLYIKRRFMNYLKMRGIISRLTS